MGALWIVVIILVLLVFYAISIKNSFVTLGNKTDEAFSTMDVYLKKRYDMIPNLVETVKGYAKHEAGTLDAVISARNKAVSAGTPAAKAEAESEVSSTLKNLFALTESYPELKANTNFLQLQKQLQDMENEIANSRKYYNGCVRQFNTKVEQFPSSIIAGMFNYQKQPMFTVESEKERDNVKVQF